MPRGDNWRRPAVERFWEKVDKTGPCWQWTGGFKSTGYGTFWDGTRNVGAHHWAYESTIGPVPDGLLLDHLCRNRGCVNPAHLEAVTNRVNVQRGEAGYHMKEWALERTHCASGHEYTPENTYSPPGQAKRICRTCRTLRKRRYRALAVRALRTQDGEQCPGGDTPHPFVPGVSVDHAPGESDPTWCNTCGEARSTQDGER